MPEAAAYKLSLTVFVKFNIAEALDVVCAEVDTENTCSLLAETVLPSENIEVNIILCSESLMGYPVKRSLFVKGLVLIGICICKPHSLVGISACLTDRKSTRLNSSHQII